MGDRTAGQQAGLDGRRALESVWGQLAIAAVLSAVVVRAVGPRLRGVLGLGAANVRATEIGLRDVLFSLVPAELGVPGWEPGQFAEYEWSASESASVSGAAPRRVRVEVLRRLAPTDARAVQFGTPHEDMHWLRLRALRQFRAQPVDVYRLAAPLSLTVSDATPSFAFSEGYFAVPSRPSPREWGERLEFVDVGPEVVATEDGELACRKLEWREPGSRGAVLAEVWTSPLVAPLGVVRVRTASESLLLVQRGRIEPGTLPDAIAPLVEGRSTMSRACNSCHGNDCRERLAFEATSPPPMHPLDGGDLVLDLTDDLYHRMKAGLFVPSREPLVLRATRSGEGIEGDPAPGEYLTFFREGGSLAVRADRRGAVVAHLDREAALSHLTVTTRPECGLSREFEEMPRHPIR